ncbi:hypothetical protein GM3709_2526 [Geminocystis sp. NIES-3709]|nr:hypothetical protein GM3709_2526 [Geminocystis sp. NIES-3709]
MTNGKNLSFVGYLFFFALCYRKKQIDLLIVQSLMTNCA